MGPEALEERLNPVGDVEPDHPARVSARSVATEEEVRPPGAVAVVGEVRREQRVEVAARLEGLAEQADPGLVRRLAALPVVARLAGRDEVVPGVAATAVSRDDVVE